MNRRDAEMFARGAHIGQKHGTKPFWHHPREVVRVLEKNGFGDDEALICAAWLHDTIEDTPTTYQDIKNMFGEGVAELVWSVTDEMGRNRAERKKKTHTKIFQARSTIALKLADLTANIEDAYKNQDSLMRMYMKEWEESYSTFKEGIETCAIELLPMLSKLDQMMRIAQLERDGVDAIGPGK